MSENMTLPLPTTREAVVSAGISRLVDQAFDGFSDDLAAYAADPQRHRERSGGTTLTSDNEGVIWEGGTYGSVPVEVTDADRLAQVWEAFLGHGVTQAGMRYPETTHLTMIREANELSGPDRYTPSAAILLLHVLRDRYPEDDTDWRESLMPKRGDYDRVPEDEWGERHKVGIELRVGFDDAWAPEHPTQWRFGVFLQTRFDRPTPQHEIRSDLSGMVHSLHARRFEPHEQQKRQAKLSDVVRMAELFELARDIRPYATEIGQLLESQAVIDNMAKEFFGGSEDATASSAPVQ